MNFAVYIAKRYLLSKKKQNVVNIISLISVIGVCVGTMGLIIVLSVFNGFESLVINLYNTFDPDIKITAEKGKVFSLDTTRTDQLTKIEGVKYIIQALEENALFKYHDKQYIGIIKGLSPEFVSHSSIDTMMLDGKLELKKGKTNYLVIGEGVAYYLSFHMSHALPNINIYLPRRGEIDMQNPQDAFNSATVPVSGVFAIQQEFDGKYILAPIDLVRELLEYKNQVSALEITLNKGASADEVTKRMKAILGNGYEVKDRYQQHEMLYKIMKSEKWAVYLILTFILIIATFNVIGSLTMLIIDKKKDIRILWSMGANDSLIRRIFLVEGVLISLIGAVAGLLLGAFVCFLQQQFGFIKLQGSGSFVIDSYPVQMLPADFLYVFLTVFVIGLIAAWFPAKHIVRRQIYRKIN